jgi:hypothetical protein
MQPGRLRTMIQMKLSVRKKLSKQANSSGSPEITNQWESSSSADEGSAAANGASKSSDKGKEREGTSLKKFRGIPEDVKLFEVFWQQIVALIKVIVVLMNTLSVS